MLRDTSYCADTEPRVKAEPPHPPHEFRDFANLLAPYSAAELSNSASQLVNQIIATVLIYYFVTGSLSSGLPAS